jgi:dolichyl-phosphate beta-glucosyltransferase
MPNTCIIVPCYNEAVRLNKAAFIDFLSKEKNISICFGDDGSTDATLAVLQSISAVFPERVLIICQKTNGGKASIIRESAKEMFNRNSFDYIGYFDADLSSPLEAALPFVAFLEATPGCNIVFGSRIENGEAIIKKTYFRHYSGRLFSFFINRLFLIGLYDTQCGAKVFRSSLVPLLFDKPFISRWLFDIEIILRLRSQQPFNARGIEEKPLEKWINQPGSKIKFTELLMLPFQLIKIKNRYKSE